MTGFTDRTFGVEVEFLTSTSRESVAREMRARGLAVAVEGYNHVVGSHWKLVTDGSCGYELVSPILSGADGLRQVRLASESLMAAGAKVDKRCGFHVHHEGKDLSVANVRTLARLVNRFKPVIDGLLPASRRAAYFAQQFTPDELERLESATEKVCGLERSGYNGSRLARGEGSASFSSCLLVRGRRGKPCQACSCQRYRSLNLRAMHRYGTVEFRQHSGTVEADKMVGWIVLTQGLVEKAKHGRGRRPRVEANGDGFKNLLRAAGLQDCVPHGHKVAPEWAELAKEVSSFLRKRARKFGVIALRDNSARRSREGRTTRRSRSAAERVALAVAAADSSTTGAVAAATAEG